MKVPQSKKAMKLLENAQPFCEILLVCDQKLVFNRSPSEDLRSVPVFVDADDNVWDTENSLDAERYLLTQKKDHAQATEGLRTQLEQVMSERDKAVREMVELREQEVQRLPDLFMMPSSQFTPEELQHATLGFSDGLKVGQGGFGVVYKGFLGNTTVAIKMLSSTGVQGQSEFKQEARTHIIAEICSALSFLHKNKPHAVVHGDIKPANIPLDGNLVSKLCDFGASRHLIQSGTDSGTFCCTSHPWGTPGYMNPEFHTTGVLTPRSDTYSFGVTILRMLTAKSPLNLSRVVRDASERGDLRSVMDTSAGDWPIAQAKRLVQLALRCTEMTSDKRPDMAAEVWSVVTGLADEANGEASAWHVGSMKRAAAWYWGGEPGASVQVLVWNKNS
ncbi:U-box domain-containing protein 33 [Dichanthelium oligosanthes]|uniref:RING-type E3 ubiquitin transferase n=1 Tax=Dichanthelium oligosanthes TaxID=888268 RepID=A0A1E5UR91_9POAL|nr:U-box domain-containing protein 33 [Dichanthelium oligosanthes]